MMFDAITTMAANVQGRAGARARHHGAQRSTVLPDVPTIAEAGVPGYEATIWLGIMAPAGTPQADRRQAQRRDQQGRRPRRGEGGLGQAGRGADDDDAGEFDKYLRDDIEKWAHVIKISGMQTQ